MSVNSIGFSGAAPSFGPLIGNSSQGAKFDAIAEQLQEQTIPNKDGAQVTYIQTPNGPKPIGETMNGTSIWEAGYANPLAVNQFKSQLSQALQAEAASSGNSTSAPPGSTTSQTPGSAALYNLINQLGNDAPSSAALLSSWNNMMQSGGDAGDAQSSTLQAFLQNVESGALDISV